LNITFFKNSNRGFTLLELLVALVLLVMLSGALYGTYFTVEDRDIFGKPASILDFTAFTVPQSGSVPSSDVMAVRYKPLEREEQKIILSRQTQDIYLDSKPLPYPLTEQIEGFLVECYDGNQWVKSWDTALNAGLPKAVRITLFVQGSDKPVGFSAIVVPRLVGA
jgi:general secretion pathway protein J